jgi:putative ABC transport system ATP-binding protein
MSAMIELAAVSKQFAGKRDVIALDAVSLTITSGEMVLIIGPSGSGNRRSTWSADSTTRPPVRSDGERLADLSDDADQVRRDKIGFIFQFFNLLDALPPSRTSAWLTCAAGRESDERPRAADPGQLDRRMTHLPEELRR